MEFFQNLRIVPRWMIVFMDAMIVFHAAFFAFFVRFNFNLDQVDRFQILPAVFLFTILSIIAMLFTRSYIGIIRHTHMGDLVNMMKMLGITHILLLVSRSINEISGLTDISNFLPASVGLIAALLAFPLLIGYRLLVKEVYHKMLSFKLKNNTKKVAIFGAGSAGILTYQALVGNGKSEWSPVAFIDDDILKSGKLLFGKRIFLGTEGLKQAIDKLGVEELVIAIDNLEPKRKREVINICLDLGIPSKIIPPADQWFHVGISLKTQDIRDVKIEDLLSREEIKMNNGNVVQEIEGRVILVTGAAGSIGSELSRQLSKCGPSKLILLDQAESPLYDLQQELKNISGNHEIEYLIADIRKRDRMRDVFDKYRPQMVFHATAYKHVPMMEAYPEEAIHCNVLGTKNLADMAVDFGVEKFVMVSTDKAVNPTNVMGATKRLAEMYVQSLDHHLSFINKKYPTRFITTRFGNVLGSNGSVIPLFRKQIMEGGPLTVTHEDIVRYFMTIPEACQLVLEAGVMGQGGEIFVFDMGEPVKIVDLAKKMIQLSGKRVGEDVKIEFTGLRPGEKLFEELLNNFEMVKPTYHPKIKIAQVQTTDYSRLSKDLGMLDEFIDSGDEMELVKQLKLIIPEFISNYSRFEVLDKTNKILN